MVSQSELANARYYICVGELAKLLLCTSIALLFVLSCSAQINSSEVTGIVTDATGAVINFASVQAMQLSTQQKHSVATDKAGRYVLVDLPPGEYELTIDADGFQHAVQRAVVLHSGDHTRRDFSLAVASSNHLIEVKPVPSVMQVESAELKNVIDNHQMVGLPLKNRQFLELALLSPGIVNSPGGTRGDSLQQTGAVINVLGNRAGHNLFLVDGANTTDEYFNNVVLRVC